MKGFKLGMSEVDRAYDSIVTYWADHGYGPTLREIKEIAGLSSTSVCSTVVRKLVKAGRLMVELESARTLRPTNYGSTWKQGRAVR